MSIEMGFGSFDDGSDTLDTGPAAITIPDELRQYFSQLDPTVFKNVNNPAIENPFKVALDTSLVGDPSDVQVPASVLMEFKNLYTPTELTSILNDYETQTGDKEGAALLKNLFGTDTTLSDTTIKKAGEIPKDTGNIASTNSNASTGIKKILEDLKKGFKDVTGLDAGDAAKYAAIIAAMKMAYDDAERARKEAKGTPFKSSSGYSAVTGPGGVTGFRRAAQGGVMSIADGVQPMYLGGPTDGMADQVPAHIDNKRPAALSDGEFIIPADVVSHLGNGNSNAGAHRLYKMMDDIREARTGNREQGVQINPNKFMPR